MSSQWWYQWYRTWFDATICDSPFIRYNNHKIDHIYQLYACALDNVNIGLIKISSGSMKCHQVTNVAHVGSNELKTMDKMKISLLSN
jgi:hypothetical protein